MSNNSFRCTSKQKQVRESLYELESEKDDESELHTEERCLANKEDLEEEEQEDQRSEQEYVEYM